MRTYFTLFTLSFFTAMFVTPLVRRKASEWGAIAKPDNGRHIHSNPTPRLGGVAIYLGVHHYLFYACHFWAIWSAIVSAPIFRISSLCSLPLPSFFFSASTTIFAARRPR